MGIRKTIAAVIAAAMMLSMTACANSENPNVNGGGTIQTGSNSTNYSVPIIQDGEKEPAVSEPVKELGIWDVLPEIPVTDASAFKYEYDSELEGMVVTDYLKESPKVRIPATLEGEPVVKVDFSECRKELTQLVMPNSVQVFSLSYTIKDTLQYVNIPDSMDVIGYSKFRSYSKLTNVYIPNSVARIADGEHSIDNSGGFPINSAAFDSCEELTTVAYKGKTYDYEHIGLLYDAINLGESGMLIEDGVLRDVSREFSEVDIPDGVTEIYYDAFRDCTNLTAINVIGENSKYYSIDGLLYEKTDNGGVILSKCPNGKSGNINVPDGVTEIGYCVFKNCTNITNVNISDSVTQISSQAFEDCTSLISITIPNSVTQIGSYAFQNCTNLTSVVIGNGVTTIGSSAFKNCTNLASVIMPNRLTGIDSDTFNGCIALKEITIPDGVTRIGSEVFSGCENLTNVVFPDSVIEIHVYDNGWLYTTTPFDGCQNIKVTYKGKTYDYKNLNKLYDAINLGESGMLIENGVLKDVSRGLTELIIPDIVTEIDKDAFKECYDLTSITTGKGIIGIGEYAFCDLTNLKSVTISDGTTGIGDCAFAGCRSLTSINIPSSVKRIGRAAFSGCESLTSITLPAEVVISCEDSYYVGYGTFEGSNIIEVICENKTYSVEDFYKTNGSHYRF